MISHEEHEEIENLRLDGQQHGAAAQLATVAIENEILEPILQFGTCAAARLSRACGRDTHF